MILGKVKSYFFDLGLVRMCDIRLGFCESDLETDLVQLADEVSPPHAAEVAQLVRPLLVRALIVIVLPVIVIIVLVFLILFSVPLFFL